MRARTLRSFDHLLDDVVRSCAIGIAHSEIDDIFSALPRSRLQLSNDVEHIWRQPADSAEFTHLARVTSNRLSPWRPNTSSTQSRNNPHEARAGPGSPVRPSCPRSPPCPFSPL